MDKVHTTYGPKWTRFQQGHFHEERTLTVVWASGRNYGLTLIYPDNKVICANWEVA